MFLRRLPLFLLVLNLGLLPAKAQSRRDIFSIGGSIRDGIDQHAMDNIQVSLLLTVNGMVMPFISPGTS